MGSRFAPWSLAVFSVLVAGSLGASCVGCEEELETLTPLITPSSDRMSFGTVYLGYPREATVELRSAGTASLTVTDVVLDGEALTAGFTLQNRPTFPVTLAPGTTLPLLLRAAPGVPGYVEGGLVVRSDAENTPQLTVVLSAGALSPPTCQDENPCTDDGFDPGTEACRFVPREGACEDNNACTTAGRCVDGVCLGEAVECEQPEAGCFVAVCDATLGCVNVTDPDACNDDNPCTLDVCDGALGCRNEALADWTPCGPLDGCLSRVCLAGACEDYVLPDSAPCSDGDLCTVDDRCTAGTCSGEREATDPSPLGRAFGFGGPTSAAVMLTADRVVFVDRATAGLETPWGTPQASLVTRVDDRLEWRSSSELLPLAAELTPIELARVSDVRFVMRHADTVRLYGVNTGDTIALLDAALLEATPVERTLPAGFGDRVFFCGDDGILVLVVEGDVIGTEPTLALSAPCRDLTVDDATARLFVATDSGVAVFDLATPSAPTLASELSVEGGAHRVSAEDGVLAVAHVRTDGTEGVTLHDAATLDVGSSPVSFVLDDGEAVDVEITGNTLFAAKAGAGVGGQVQVTPVASADAPGETSLLQLSVRDPFVDNPVLDGGYGVLIRSARHADTTRLLAVRDDATQVQLTGLGHGGFLTLDRVSGRVLSHGVSALHAIDVELGGVIDLEAGGALFDSMERAFVVDDGFTLGPAAYRRKDPAEIEWTLRNENGPSDHAFIDATNVAYPGPPQWFRLPDVADRALVAAKGRVLFTVWGDGASFSVGAIDLAQTNGATWDFDTVVDLPLSIPLGASLPPLPSTLSLSDDRDELLVVSPGPVSADTEVRLWIVDVSAPLSPAVTFKATLDGAVVDAAVSRHHVVVLERDTAASPSTPFVSTRARRFTRQGQLLVDERIIEGVDAANHVLAFDGRNALFSTPTGILYADFAASPPAVIGTLPTSQPPVDAQVVGDVLLFTTETAVAAASPPCPAP